MPTRGRTSRYRLHLADPYTAQVSTSACGIPDDATAIVVSTTIVRPQQKGWLVAYPTGTTRPTAATLNWNAGTTRANTATVTIGNDDKIEIYRQDGFGRGSVVIDVVGAFVPTDVATSGRLVVLDTAQRILDSRDNSGNALGPDSTVRVPLPDGVPTDAIALAVNLTVTGTRSNGFFTLFPAGTDVARSVGAQRRPARPDPCRGDHRAGHTRRLRPVHQGRSTRRGRHHRLVHRRVR